MYHKFEKYEISSFTNIFDNNKKNILISLNMGQIKIVFVVDVQQGAMHFSVDKKYIEFYMILTLINNKFKI